ncbi:endonuclease/exonuclease/phosphatase family protein [Parabacteroides sp. PF5-9]|uniref:endonuclease/exonuclease/phosphatase family protein n=1 Tax=Parabacteroides sp. PF5-9 TaxID=1742404 RepID=UPI002473829C|nr:endonuclease/exonuclease/phosphatase family protein [Parabacteroides sp. PF5-9]MDH6359208.1 endonuclease/exonuclease/phosphatase family metal-dependent hydrolase [Parabacteroides sp. PF5-9]
MKTLKALLRILFVATHLLVIVLFLLAAYSDKISPEKSMFMAFVGLAFPILGVLNGCFSMVWLFVKRWNYFLVGLVSFFLCWGAVGRYFPFHATAEIPEENTLKILTYNVMAFGNKAHTAQEPNKIVEYIASSDADIVCLQEYAVVRSGRGLTSESLFKALKMYPFRSVIRINQRGAQTNGLAVFSKYPISNSKKINYESNYNGSSVHEINVNGKKLILINNHLESFKLTSKDKSQYASVFRNLDSESLGELRGPILHKLSDAFRIRAKQAEAVAQKIENTKGDYMLVCGDFNDTPISYTHHVIQGDLIDAFAASGRGMGATYNQNFFWFRIDNILHSSNMQSFNCKVDKVKYSDHYPVWCYLQLQ